MWLSNRADSQGFTWQRIVEPVGRPIRGRGAKAPPSGIRCECWPVTPASRCFRFLLLSSRVNVHFFTTLCPSRSSLRTLATVSCYVSVISLRRASVLAVLVYAFHIKYVGYWEVYCLLLGRSSCMCKGSGGQKPRTKLAAKVSRKQNVVLKSYVHKLHTTTGWL